MIPTLIIRYPICTTKTVSLRMVSEWVAFAWVITKVKKVYLMFLQLNFKPNLPLGLLKVAMAICEGASIMPIF